MTENELLLTVGDIAERLKLNPETIRRWLRAGRLRGIRLGERRAGWRVSESNFTAFLRERQTARESEDRRDG